jgi:hypothetical protein
VGSVDDTVVSVVFFTSPTFVLLNTKTVLAFSFELFFFIFFSSNLARADQGKKLSMPMETLAMLN